MRWLVLSLLLLAFPAHADLFQNASNADLPWALATDNNPALNGGIGITSGYTGPIDNTAQFRWWGTRVQYGGQDCTQHMFNIFRPIRGFSAGIASCAETPAGSTVTQFIPGLFSVVSGPPAAAPIAVIAQGVVGPQTAGGALSGAGVMGLNTLKQDTTVTSDSTSGSISGTTLTVGGTFNGTVGIGDIVQSPSGGIASGTHVLAQLSGATGGAGTYRVSHSQTVGGRVIITKAYQFSTTVQDEYDSFCNHNDTRCRNIIDGSFPSGDQANVYGATIGGTVTAGDVLNLTITDATVTGSPKLVSYTAVGGDTAALAAAGLAQAVNNDAALQAAAYHARAVGSVVRIYYPTNYGPLQRPTVSFAQSVTGTATITLGLLVSGADARYGIGTVLFTGSVGKWQNSFQSGNGAADFALVVGTALPPTGLIGARSQGIKFYYTDNTTAGVTRVTTMFADPAAAGASGTDVVFNSHSNQPVNLSVPVGNLKVGAMPTSAGAGGLAVCIDAAGVMYKKAACP